MRSAPAAGHAGAAPAQGIGPGREFTIAHLSAPPPHRGSPLRAGLTWVELALPSGDDVAGRPRCGRTNSRHSPREGSIVARRARAGDSRGRLTNTEGDAVACMRRRVPSGRWVARPITTASRPLGEPARPACWLAASSGGSGSNASPLPSRGAPSGRPRARRVSQILCSW